MNLKLMKLLNNYFFDLAYLSVPIYPPLPRLSLEGNLLLKKVTWMVVVLCTCHPSSQEARAGGMKILREPGLHSIRPCLRIQKGGQAGMSIHTYTCNLNVLEGRQGVGEFEASLNYIASSRPVWAA